MNLIPIHKNIYIPDFRFETKYKSKKVFYTVKAFFKVKSPISNSNKPNDLTYELMNEICH